MEKLSFISDLIHINNHYIVKLPIEISTILPSRGMCMSNLTIMDTAYTLPLEPDGKGSHYFELLPSIIHDLSLPDKQSIEITMELTEEWVEPTVPDDILSSLQEYEILPLWNSLTTKARWEWIRWIRATNNSDTRKKRIHTACSKLLSGKRRPCCFNASQCTEPNLSKTGKLLV